MSRRKVPPWLALGALPDFVVAAANNLPAELNSIAPDRWPAQGREAASS
ncbi:MAG: hypothetical protein ABSG36_17295 [Acidimicrobiales bacterium]|jgi:hypothetical protein